MAFSGDCTGQKMVGDPELVGYGLVPGGSNSTRASHKAGGCGGFEAGVLAVLCVMTRQCLFSLPLAVLRAAGGRV